MNNLGIAWKHAAPILVLLGWAAAALATQPGSLDTAYQPVLDGPVKAIAPLADGKALIGGAFATVNGSARAGIARLNVDGTLDPTFDSGPGIAGDTNRAVNAILVQPDGKVLVGGNFAQINGVRRVNLARLNADGSVDMGFAPGCGTVYCLALQSDGKILYGSQNVGRLNADGTANQDLSGQLFGYFHGYTSIPPSVNTILVQANGQILFQGFYTRISGDYRYGFARLHANGGLDPTFPSPPQPKRNQFELGDWPSAASVAAQPDGKLLLGCGIFCFDGWNRRLVRLDANGVLETNFMTPLPLDLSFSPFSRNAIHAILVQTNDDILVSGDFDAVIVNGQRQIRSNLVRLTSSGGLDYEFAAHAGTDTPATVMVSQFDGPVLLGGAFTNVNGTARSYLARLHGVESAARVPTILTQPTGTNALEGETFTLSVSADGAALRYQWRRNNLAIPGATGPSLTLTNARPADTGCYAVSVRNDVAEAMSAAATVTIHGFAEALNSPGLSYTSTYGSYLTWYAIVQNAGGGFVLDQVSFASGVVFSPTQARFSPETGFRFPVTVATNEVYQFERSTDLIQWTPWMTLTPANFILDLHDPSATNRSQTFYRARALGF